MWPPDAVALAPVWETTLDYIIYIGFTVPLENDSAFTKPGTVS